MKTLLRICAAIAMALTMSLATSGNAQAATPKTWLSVSSGFIHTCGITTNHSLYCWGGNTYGGLGVGDDLNPRYIPQQVGTDTNWAKVTIGDYHTCAIKTTGALYCWGYNYEGNLGLGSNLTKQYNTPQRVGTSTRWASVSAGQEHTCGRLTTGALYCWGYDADGQLGVGDFDDHYQPTRVGASTNWTSVSAGGSHTCARLSSGSLYCWGDNSYTQLGIGAGSDKNTPRKVGTSTRWSSVSGGGTFTCARHQTGSLFCWGFGGNGELGQGKDDLDNHGTPQKVGISTNWLSVNAGTDHTCAKYKTGSLYCWGDGENGRLGLGDNLSKRTLPTKVGISTHWSSVDTGGFHTCAKYSTGAIYCWGLNNVGQLGLDDANQRNTPVKLS